MSADAGGWQAANSLSVMVEARILEFARRQSVIMPLFNFIDGRNQPGVVVGVNRWIEMDTDVQSGTQGGVGDGTALTNLDPVQPTTAQLTAVVSGIATEVTDLLQSGFDGDAVAAVAQPMQEAVVEEMDDDFAALFGTVTATGGATGQLMSLDYFLNGLVDIQTAQAPPPYFAIMHPKQAMELGLHVGGFVLAAEGTTTSTPPIGGSVAGTNTASVVDRLGVGSGAIGAIAGVPAFVSARVVSDGTDYEGFIGSRDCCSIYSKWLVRAETERSALGVSTFLAATGAWGVGITANSFGSKLVSID